MLGLALPYVGKMKTMGKKQRTESLKRRLRKILQKFCELPKKTRKFSCDVTNNHTSCLSRKNRGEQFLVAFK